MRSRVNHSLIGKPAIFLFLFGLSTLTCLSQDNADRWLRVLTDEDSTIEVNRFSLVLEPDQVIRADFRTTFVKPVSLTGTPGGSYQSRLDSIQFRLNEKRYRIRESKFVDGSGHVLSSSSPVGTNVWKSAWGRTGSALFSAATQLRPFGTWKIVSYRYASGEKPSKNDPPELRSLVGSDMHLGFDRVQVANLTCDSPILEPAAIKGEEFTRQVGSSLESIGVSDNADALYLRCKGYRQVGSSDPRPSRRPTLKRRQQDMPKPSDPSDQPLVNDYQPPVNHYVPSNFPNTTLILRRSDDRILMLWDGVFLELARTQNIFLPRSYQ